MKLKLLFASILCLGAVHACAKQGAKERIRTNQKQLSIKITNKTDVDFGKVSATFRFYGDNSLEQEFIEGTLTTDELEPNKGLTFNSDDVTYKGKNIKNYFGRGPSNVVLYKLSAGRWRVKGTNWMLRSTRRVFKNGTQQKNFTIVTSKGRFGYPTYSILPMVNEDISAR